MIIIIYNDILVFIDFSIVFFDSAANGSFVNNKELSNYIITAKISFQEHLKVSCDLEEGIEKYQNALKYDSYGYDLDINNMKVNYINDNENIYNNCLLIYITLKSKE